jgi:hypothetical protein
MQVLDIISKYWGLILFAGSFLITLGKYQLAQTRAIKCSLRNDILEIWDKARKEKKITKYQLQALELSYAEYKKLKGNSFVDDIHERVKGFEIID